VATTAVAKVPLPRSNYHQLCGVMCDRVCSCDRARACARALV
jgi:hypothetical protein